MNTLTLPVDAARDHILGPDDAPITLVEYGDFECPHCGAAYPIVEILRQKMGERLRYVYRHFPLTQIHKHAQKASEASEAAGAQGKFWEMHRALYAGQRALGDIHLKEMADAEGLDRAQFDSDVFENNTFYDHVREDFMSGVRAGVNGTPAFFINGVLHQDSWDEETLGEALEEAAQQK